MSEAPSICQISPPSLRSRLRWRLQDTRRSIRGAVDGVMHRLGYARMESDTNYISHARREFRAAGWDLAADEMQALMCDQVCDLLRVFGNHGHSGSSAPYALKMFTTLAKFEPLVPLSGADDEWNEVSDGCFQNNRCGHVFKDANRFDGQAYDIDAVIFREPNGSCYTSRESHRPITFPYTPTREYVDRPVS